MQYDGEHRLAYRKLIDEFAIIAKTDRTGRIIDVNDSFCEISQYTKDELIGQTHSLLNSGFHPKSFFKEMRQTISSGQVWRGEIRNKAKDGSFFWVMMTIMPETDAAGGVTGYLAIQIDVTGRHNAEDALQKESRNREDAEDMLRNVIEAMPIGVAAYDRDDRLLLSNSLYRDIVPSPLFASAPKSTFEEIIRSAVEQGAIATPDGSTAADKEAGIQATLKRHQTAGPASTHKLTDGRWIQAQGRRTPAGESVEVVTDISAIKKAEKLVKEQVKLDPLTGILNRTGFELELKHAVSEYEADATKFALALVDIDHFKRVNDRMGHAAGDSVLIAVASRLKNLPGVRCAARVGGDEFAVLVDLPDGDKKEFAASANRAADRCFRPVDVGGKLIDLSGSVGVALFPENGSDVEVLTRAADMALLAAKGAGRARVKLVNAEIEAQHVRRGAIADALADAILTREITPAFQPIVSAGQYDLRGMEVLARWTHPAIGVVTPDEFIPISQANGLLSDLDQMIMASACEQARDWLNSGLIGFISLNASPIELATRGYSTSLLAMLKRAGLSPDQICIEILESALIDGVPAIIRNLERLNEAGVRISLDDFGTGFSNLQAAMNLPLSGIKFDRSIIQRLNEEGMLRATTKSMATLFQNFGLYTVAEGVETESHREMAKGIGVSHMQGFLFGKPLLFEDADKFVRSHAPQKLSDGRKLA